MPINKYRLMTIKHFDSMSTQEKNNRLNEFEIIYNDLIIYLFKNDNNFICPCNNSSTKCGSLKLYYLKRHFKSQKHNIHVMNEWVEVEHNKGIK